MKQDWLTIEDFGNGIQDLKKCDKEAEGEIVIPEGVTRMCQGAFDGCNKITSLVIPEGLKWIHLDPFSDKESSNCPSLAIIHFPSNIIEMNSEVLKKTLWYENQSNGVVYAGVNVIGYKGEMPENTELVIKEGTKYIAEEAFKGCNNLVKVTLPNSLVQIGFRAFSGCKSLSTIHFPNVVEMPANVFNNTLWLDNQPEGVVYLGTTALKYKGEMPEDTEITIKEGTKYIASFAFSSKDNLKKVTLPKSLTCIDIGAFEDCRYLEQVTLPKSVVEIGNGAFSGCVNLVSVVTPEDDYLTDEKNNLSDVKGHIDNIAFFGCKKLEIVHIPSAVTSIGECAFYECDHLKTLYFPMSSSLETVDEKLWFGKDKVIPRLVFEGGFPKAEELFANRHIDELWVNDKSVLNSFPQTNHTFEHCYIDELRINLPRKNCLDIPDDIKNSLHLNDRDRGHIIYAAPKLCKENSTVPGYIRATLALDDPRHGIHEGDLIDINTKYIVSVQPDEIERYHPVTGSIIRCASNGLEIPVEYLVYEPCNRVLQKIDASLRMLSEQVGGAAGLLNQLETLLKRFPDKILLEKRS